MIENHRKLGSVDTFLNIFIEAGIYSSAYDRLFRVLNASCPEDTLKKLYLGTGVPSKPCAVWLDDREISSMIPRSYNGPMSIEGFYEALRREVFNQKGEPDATFRRIHIPSPDNWALAALVLTVSPVHAQALREFLWLHLNGDTSIHFDQTIHSPLISMVFHLKFPVWRKVVNIRKDDRQGHNGAHLRKRTDLGFLNDIEDAGAHGREEEVLYEAQASCAVTFKEEQRMPNWVVWSLVDNCFELEHEDNESSLLFYKKTSWPAGPGSDLGDISMDTLEMDDDDDSLDDEEFDPLTNGKVLASQAYSDPRLYFCLILKWRAEHIWEEWRNTVDNLERRINNHLGAPHILSLRREPTPADAVEKSMKWIIQVRDLISDLSCLIPENLKEELEEFKTRSSSHFQHFDSAKIESLFLEISAIYNRLRKIQDNLRRMKAKCEDFQNQLDRIKEHNVFVLQHWTVFAVQYTIPPSLASGIMQSEIIKFNPPIACFISLTVVIGVILLGSRQPWRQKLSKCLGG